VFAAIAHSSSPPVNFVNTQINFYGGWKSLTDGGAFRISGEALFQFVRRVLRGFLQQTESFSRQQLALGKLTEKNMS